VRQAFHGQCDGYLVKPLSISRMDALLKNLKVLPPSASLKKGDSEGQGIQTPRVG
jgi:YesN/AraC family two-component response regulator